MGAEAAARLGMIEKIEAGASSLRSQLIRVESALESADERAGGLEDELSEMGARTGEEKAQLEQELFLLKRRLDGASGAKEAAAESLAALKQSAATARAGKIAAEASLQAAEAAGKGRVALLEQELKELRDVLSLQEGAAGGAGAAAANAEAEAADLRETVGGLQREVAQAKGEAKAARLETMVA